MPEQKQWYWSLKDHRVVNEQEAIKAADRMGPYATRHDAEQAIAKAARRTEDWDTDPKWNDLEAEQARAKEHEEGAWGPFRI